MNKKRIAFHTLGCKLNFAETSSLMRELQEDCHTVDFSETADYYVVQSCAVTATAEKKCRGIIRQAHKRNPQAEIFVIGCMSQLRADTLARMDGVSLVLGNAEKYRMKEFIQNGKSQASDKVNLTNILKNKDFYPAYSGSDRTRTFIKIQDGCDYFCSFCTIPLARGRSRSNPISQTISLIKKALNEQTLEIVLTGVNIGDFGKQHNETLNGLLKEVEKLDSNARFRLSSVEPDLLGDEIIDLITESDKFMPHFHLPLQSGSDTVLKRMNRKYNSELFISRVSKIISQMPHACIAADIIAGFPGETDEEFFETYRLVEHLPLSYLHAFPYSERPDTHAASMTEKIRHDIIRQRVDSLMKLSEIKKRFFLEENTGRTETVLFESENTSGFISGFTTNYIRVKAKYNKELENSVQKTRLEKLDEDDVFIFNPLTQSQCTPE
jgi:threonylcarbamoyladenosine tRNA methylthiotransferase MtaB